MIMTRMLPFKRPSSPAHSAAVTARSPSRRWRSSEPAQAIIVFDPSNYSQNILTAARTLEQINNQIACSRTRRRASSTRRRT
jgi:P-type conjugative transfer protein TrbJ